MNLIYISRFFFWVVELVKTLTFFWLKNFKETPTILIFIFEKLKRSKKFFIRNIFIENYSDNYLSQLQQTVDLYNTYGKIFNPSDTNSYKKLDGILSTKFQILYFLLRKIKPKIVVETGVAAGESTGYILQALHDNGQGKLYSIDLPFQWYIYGKHKLHLDSLPAGKISGYLVPEKLKRNWVLIIGDTYKKLPLLLNKLIRIDVFFHDSEHTNKTMLFEYQKAWPYLSKGGFLLSDDISYSKAFFSFTKSKKETFTFKDLGLSRK